MKEIILSIISSPLGLFYAIMFLIMAGMGIGHLVENHYKHEEDMKRIELSILVEKNKAAK